MVQFLGRPNSVSISTVAAAVLQEILFYLDTVYMSGSQLYVAKQLKNGKILAMFRRWKRKMFIL